MRYGGPRTYPYPPQWRSLTILRGGGGGGYEAKLIQRGGGWGLKPRNLPWDVFVWIFSGTTILKWLFLLSCQVEQYTENYLLQWNHENNHFINQTEKMINQVLHIHFNPLSALAPGFVVKLIISRYVVIITSLLFNRQTNDFLFLFYALFLQHCQNRLVLRESHWVLSDEFRKSHWLVLGPSTAN